MNNEKIQGSGRHRGVKNQMFNCNKVCKESCFAHCHIWTLEDSVPYEELSRSLFWHEIQASDCHEELKCDFVLLSQADRYCPADSAFAYRAGAAPPCSGYFHWQWAKGKPRETGRLCIPDRSFPDAGHKGDCKSVNCALQGPQERVCMRQLSYMFLLNQSCT